MRYKIKRWVLWAAGTLAGFCVVACAVCLAFRNPLGILAFLGYAVFMACTIFGIGHNQEIDLDPPSRQIDYQTIHDFERERGLPLSWPTGEFPDGTWDETLWYEKQRDVPPNRRMPPPGRHRYIRK